MDNNQNNPINPASQNTGNPGAAESTAPIVPNDANANSQAAPVEPGTPVDNLVQDIKPAPAAEEPKPAEKPAEPAPVSQPATQPITSAQPATSFVSQPQPAMQSQPVSQPYGAPKKSHAGLIVGIVVLVLLVLVGIGGYLFYQQHEKTERVLADGLINLVTAKELTANSVINVRFDDSNSEVEYMKFNTISSYNEKYEASLDAKIEFKPRDYDAINAEAEIMEGENALYFRIVDTGNISTVVSKALEDEGEDGADIKSLLESTFTSVGDSWYEIPYSKIDDSGSLKKTIDCVREKSTQITQGENWNKVLDLYQKNAFITVTEGAKIEKVNGYKKYPLTIDEDKAEDFFDALGDEDFMKEIESCSETNISTPYAHDDDYDWDDDWDDEWGDDWDDDWDDDFYTLDDDYSSDSNRKYNEIIVEPKKQESEDKYEITLGIKPWSHEIVWVGFNSEQTQLSTKVKTDGEINLSYNSSVATPGNTKSIDEFIDTVEKSLAEGNRESYYKDYCTEENNYSGYDNESACKKAVDEAFGDDATGDIDDLLSDFMYFI